MTIKIENVDCLTNSIEDNSVDLGIYDPPFGINEGSFDKHYNRNNSNVLLGYTEAPQEYAQWTLSWMTEAHRILKQNGSMYVISGNTNLIHILNAAMSLGLKEINHIIWKFNFGVYTQKKYVTSHYHVLYYTKSITSKPIFNTNCRYGSHEKNNDKSLLYQDLEDVFVINKEFSSNKTKNQNKLPNELIKKLILYSSNPGDIVCDFFMGNFTTAYNALLLGRHVVGCEINPISFQYHYPKLFDVVFGQDIKTVANILPENQGKKISPKEIEEIEYDFRLLLEENKTKKEIINILADKYQRGFFSITNILKRLQ